MNDFYHYLENIGEFGIVTEVNYPIAQVEGLPLARPHEIVIFETGELGEVFSMDRHGIEVLIFSRDPVKVGARLARTNKTSSVPVGGALLGAIIDPIGSSISSGYPFKEFTENREVDSRPLGIAYRKRITQPFRTGVTVVDMMIPLGKGQKELVIGDRKTGKSSFLLTSTKSHINAGGIVVYALIAKKKSDIKIIEEFFANEKIRDKVVMIATSSSDSPSLIYLTPYTAMTIAEYFRDEGNDVLVVLDDLSTHAKFYREISLLARRFPGRDSYPGDIFYTHAKLMERAGNFNHAEKGEVSITCLPVAESVEGDITGYITTNLMGMTDGHIFFDSNAYYNGRRPAINISLSITRVGRQTQPKFKSDINRELAAFLLLYDKMQNFSHFGEELTDSVKAILKTGDRIYKFFNQPYSFVIPEEIQLILFCMIWLEILTDETEEDLNTIKSSMIEAFQDERVKKLFKDILDAKSFNELLSNVSKNKEKLVALCRKNLKLQEK